MAVVSVILFAGPAFALPFFRAAFLAYDAGPDPTSLRVLDVDGDGSLDAVVANHIPGSVVVLRNNGRGAFHPVTIVEFPQDNMNPRWKLDAALLDLNGDERRDLVVANDFADTGISILLAAEDGTYADPVTYLIQGRTLDMNFTDVNGDSTTDIVALSMDSDKVGILVGNGDGTFQDATFLDVPGFAWSCRIGNLSANDIPDLAISTSGAILVRPGDGKGGFGPPATFPAPTGRLEIEDVTGDGHADIISTGGPFVLPGHGDGTFGSIHTLDTEQEIGGIAIADFDGDGRKDIAATVASHVRIYWGDAQGQFTSRQDYPAGNDARAVAAGDFTGDGRPDILAAGRTVALLINNGDRTFGDEHMIPTEGTSGLALGRLTGDDHLDIATTAYDPPRLLVFPGNGLGSFAPPVETPAQSGAADIETDDVNGDGLQDVVTANYDSGTVSIFLRAPGSDGFEPRIDRTTGAWELGPAGSAGPTGAALEAGSLNSSTSPPPEPVTPGPIALLVRDLDGDTLPEILVVNLNTDSLVVFAGKIDSASSRVSYPTGDRPFGITAGDLDEDGYQDVVTANRSGTVSVFRGDSAGGLQPREDIPAGADPFDVALGYFDADSHIDLAIVNLKSYGRKAVSIRPGDGHGGFGDPTTYTAGYNAGRISVGDFDGDGTSDVAVCNLESNTVTIVCPEAGTVSDFGTGSFPYSIQSGDVDEDGRPDIVVQGSRAISVLTRTDNVTPVLLHDLSCRVVPDGIELGWTVDSGAPIVGFHVHRLSNGDREERLTSTPLRGGPVFQFRDTGIRDPGDYTYRILAVLRSGSEESAGQLTVHYDGTPRPPETRILSVSPNPSRGPIRILCHVGRAGPIEFRITDVNGRLLRRLAGPMSQAGPAALDWDGRTDSGNRCPQGVYFVSISGSRSPVMKFQIVR